jgi:hypothetical protein
LSRNVHKKLPQKKTGSVLQDRPKTTAHPQDKVMASSEQRLAELTLQAHAAVWAEGSGALAKKESAGSSYAQYLDASSIQEDETDIKQIKKDVDSGRTDAKCFSEELMRLACADVSREQLSRVLSAYCRRNQRPGYAQGMNFMASLLLACTQDEEMAFWILCAIVEDRRDPDFYARPPAAMNGFVAESAVIAAFGPIAAPTLAEAITDETIELSLQMLAPKALIPCFVDLLPLEAVVMIWDDFLGSGPEAKTALVRACLALVTIYEAEITAANDGMPYALIVEKGRTMDSSKVTEMKVAMEAIKGTVRVDDYCRKLAEAKSRLAQQWSQGTTMLGKLDACTHFDKSELGRLQVQSINSTRGGRYSLLIAQGAGTV